MSSNCFAHRDVSDWLRLPDDMQTMATSLVKLGILKSADCHGVLHVALLDTALGSLTRIWKLSGSMPVLRIREEIAVEDRTSLEFFLMLKSDGFSWAQWKAPNSRRKGEFIPVGYKPGQPKIFYSNAHTRTVICSKYLLCLLKAKERSSSRVAMTSSSE